ncbi:hypothetical protein C0J52_06359 [Blattella germanica]|nr:hypothetical protein C0J52_06359 [Blattella germanica]
MKLWTAVFLVLSCCTGFTDPRVVVALLALHDGVNCTQESPKGSQQLANLHSFLRELNAMNREISVKTDLIALDTCSRPEIAVKMTLRALVMVEQTGLKAPHFLGFLGPYDWASLKVVAPVTKVFGLTHVVPYSRGPQIENVLAVTSPDLKRTAQAAVTLFKKLQWAAVLLVNTGAESASGVVVLMDRLQKLVEINATVIVLMLESTEPEVYGLNLLTAAGAMVRRDMSAEEWSGALRSTTAFRRGTKIRFDMEVPSQVYLRLPGQKQLLQAGNVTSEKAFLLPDLQIPAVNVTSCLMPTSEREFYLMIGMMTGIGVGLLLCLFLGIYIVNYTFKAPSDSNS